MVIYEPKEFKRMPLRTYIIGAMRFDTFRMAIRQLTNTCNSGLTVASHTHWLYAIPPGGGGGGNYPQPTIIICVAVKKSVVLYHYVYDTNYLVCHLL